MTAVVQVHGMDELRSALTRLGKDTPKELLKANERIAHSLFIPEAVKLAPKGPHQGGGRVAPVSQSIHALVSENKIVLVAGGPRTPYALPLEFGGSIPRRGYRKQGNRAKRLARSYGAKTVTHIKARPFIYPALERKVAAALAVYDQMLARLIQRYASA